jgi:WD40 repeat protein/serine/threonine protein kinase
MLDGAESRLVGRRLGEFVVREPLSAGGFGTVYRAEQTTLAREAVIKVMHTNLRASETLIQRFLREAKLASRLDHPFAAHIYAFGAESDGVLWIAMELVRGTPLDKLLAAQGPISLERFVPLLERICQVVQTAHDQGIVHRDLKPGNVMVLARAGQLLPKLLDLGIAKLADESDPVAPRTDQVAIPEDKDEAFARTAAPTPPPESDPARSGGRLTEEGAVMGSPLYMAPEQWLDAAAADARTDIYALGVLSYEALTGQAPFGGANRHQIAMAHAQKEPPKLGGELPVALDAVLARALAKQPQARFGSALELAAAFRKASGLVDEPAALPRLAEDVRLAVTARAPQPIAQAASVLEAARNPHQARDAVWQLVRVAVRTVAAFALAAHAHVGGKRGDLRTTEAVRRLRRRALPDAEWLAIARELVLPFAKLRDAHPIPELVDFLTGPGAALVDELLALRDTAEGSASDASVRELLVGVLPVVERMLGALGFLSDYRLVVPGEGGARLWMGVRRTDPPIASVRGRVLAAGQPALLDATGLPVVTLWPFLQLHEPARGVGARLMFLEGTGRRGARMIALPEAFEHEDETLWEVIGTLAEDTSAQTSSQEVCPFPGLSAFTAEDATRFVGRERETEELVNRLHAQPLLAVVGPSGAGKSSFVQAGVVPHLVGDWEVVVLRPGASPLVSLAARVARLGFDPAELKRELVADPSRLGARLHTRAGKVVIVVDQVEELFTLCEDESERERFIEALVGAARTVDDPVRVVMTLRDDFLLRAEALPALRTRLAPALHLLTTPARDDLLRILVEPLRRAGYELDDPALAGEMVDALAGARGALALLSFTASKLWELRDRRFRQLTRKTYLSLGGIGGALARHAEQTLDAMMPDEQRLVREVFRHAVTSEGTRTVLLRGELEEVLGGQRSGHTVIEKLVAARLLVGSEGPTGGEQIEITHEALIEAWPRLVAWRSEDAEGTRLRDQLRTTARQWDERGRPTGLLWRGDALAEYRLWRSRFPGNLTAIETAFGDSSVSDAARSQRRRRVLLAGSFAVLAAGVIALGVLNRQVAQERASALDNAQQLHANLLGSYEAQARQYLQTGDYNRALAFLDEARKLGASGPAHDLVVAFTASGLHGKIRSFSHDLGVIDARFSPDGARLASAGLDKRARIWNVADGRLLAELSHAEAVQSVQYLADGNVLTASDDGTAVLWDGATGGKLVTFDAHVAGINLAMAVAAPDGTLFVTVGADDAVRLWDRTGKLAAELHAPGKGRLVNNARGCAFSPDGKRVALGAHDGTIRVWDTQSHALLGTASGHSDQINTLVFARDGERFVTASDDRTAIVWDAANVKPVAKVHHDDAVLGAVFSPDGKTIATASNDHTAKLWDATTGTRIRSLEGQRGGVNSVEFSPDGKQLATASDDATLILWDPDTGRQLSRLVGQAAFFYAHFDPNGERVVTASADHTATVWSAAPQLRAVRLAGHVGAVTAAEMSPDDRYVVSSGQDGTARLWDRSTGTQVRALPLDGSYATCARFSPDGALIATANVHSIQLWSAQTGQLAATLPVADTNDLDWARDGKQLVSANSDGIGRVWSREGKLISELPAHHGLLEAATFSPDADRIVGTSRDQTLQVWRITTGQLLEQWSSPYRYIRFDPRGELVLARAGLEAMISRTADRDHQPLALLKHDAQVMDAEWSSHGDFIVTASIDATVRIWDRSGQLLMTLGDGHSLWWSARFSADDHFIVSGSASGIMVWELPRFEGSFDDLVKCKRYELRGTQLVVTKRGPDCT